MYGSPMDFGFLPPQFKGDVQLFFSNGTLPASQGWQIWQKPRGISMVYMITISGGGGGGGGFNRPGGTGDAGGGGSGGCSGITPMMMPAIFLPDQLYIFAGNGGIGGSSGVAGTAGALSIISLGNGTATAGATIPNLILQSGQAGPTGGGAGTGAAGGAAGVAGTVSTFTTTGPLGKLGFFTSTGTNTNNGYAGIAGIIGGSPSQTGFTISTTWNVLPLSPGASGAGVNSPTNGFLGGGINLQVQTYGPEVTYQSIAGGGSVILDGSSGISSFKPFFQTGGTGGSSSVSGTGGKGGNGGIGCGGGGGGAGVTGGKGGDGGSGMVAMICW
jgi:hypothetical protein